MTKPKTIKFEEMNKVFELKDGEIWRKGYVDKLDHMRNDKVVKKTNNRTFGYSGVNYNGWQMMYHRLLWVLFTKQDLLSVQQIDHINGNPRDNRIENLRLVTPRQNQQNRKEHRKGHLAGCTFRPANGKWQARIEINRKRHSLGMFATKEEAHDAYLQAVKKIEDISL